MEGFNLKKFLVENKLTTNSKILSEVTDNNFKPKGIAPENAIDESLLKKLLPKTSNTTEEAEERIWDFEGGTMFIHFQYFDVKPHGNAPDSPTYRMHNSQYYLNDYQLRLQGKDPNERVNVTLLSIDDITDPNNKVSLGSAYVSTDVYLAEQRVVFDIIQKQS
jgi:hypothetical protein